ncbi:Dabb family protein [Nonomuraea sp. ZG12]|uniref:Dabb family protein n=1 Tax=Nonomuraea sp. ZG12 TaxID=3452207 RepID=UPI003F8B76D6
MIRHVVLFTWSKDATEERKAALAAELAELPGRIPEIRSYKFGPDLGLNPGNHDFVVNADFDNEDDYRVYRDHPAHRALIDAFITPILASRAAVQFSC